VSKKTEREREGNGSKLGQVHRNIDRKKDRKRKRGGRERESKWRLFQVCEARSRRGGVSGQGADKESLTTLKVERKVHTVQVMRIQTFTCMADMLTSRQEAGF
jgi:hypothetical protein